ncbi:cytochrome P450 1A4-like [Pyrgilauda ruficollis]|uniref:cytochrome P450 1A4-like n=1 Tax=Pyrgilauda ruficollis TaxID=221976 RepID=UPI001B86A870|nr:cytochrome P450 1A4-like [Pyrgilauda ruficollis]
MPAPGLEPTGGTDTPPPPHPTTYRDPLPFPDSPPARLAASPPGIRGERGSRGERAPVAGSLLPPLRTAPAEGCPVPAVTLQAAMWPAALPGVVSASEVLLVAAVFCLVFLLLQRLQPAVPAGLRRPPGPRGYPVLGNVLELRGDTHLALTRLSRRYGDVMEVRIGTRPVLVLSGLDTIRQALVKQGDDFMGRPDLPSFRYVSNGQSLAFSPDSGEEHIRDITDSLIGHCQENSVGEDARVHLSDEKIIHIVNDLFGAGFDTVTTALSWSLMYAALYPDVQKKIQEELDRTIGRERRPRLSDRGTLPYTEAFILEVFRHSSFLPFTIPHSTTKATVLNGYYIPKDTCVFINQWQVNHDETLWKEPSAFRPERFLSAAGTELSRTESEKVLVFGLGRRRCIGETIGRWEIFLFLTTLLQQLHFSLRPGEHVDVTPQYGLTMKYKKCEAFQIRQRFPVGSSL